MHTFRFAARRLLGFGTGGTILGAAAAAVATTNPSSSSQTDRNTIHIPYLLVGGGTASYHAALTIRARDAEARVLIVGDEAHTPYNRTQLSRELWWYGDARTPQQLTYVSAISGRKRDIRYEADGFYPAPERLTDAGADGYLPHGAVAMIRGVSVERVDVAAKIAELSDGRRVRFEKCLIATGSNGKPHPKVNNYELGEAVSELRNIEDYRRLIGVFEGENPQPKRVAILGDGSLATELAYSLNRRYGHHPSRSANAVADGHDPRAVARTEIYLITPTAGVLPQVLPPTLSEHATAQMRAIGVNVLTRCSVEAAEKRENGVKLVLKRAGGGNAEDEGTSDFDFDHVIVDNGERPNVELAQRSGISLDEELGGVKADAQMRVADALWAAGDVCAFEDKTLRRRRRLAHWENAQTTGRVAGENMTGGHKTYAHQAAFEALFGAGERVHAVGEVDAQNLRTITYILRPSSAPASASKQQEEDDDLLKAVVFYVDEADADNRVLGVALLNVYNALSVDVARKIIDDALPHSEAEFDDLIKLFDLLDERHPRTDDEDEDDDDKDGVKKEDARS